MPGTSDLDQGAPSLSMLIRPVIAVIGKKRAGSESFPSQLGEF
jgi:hypothetical protein